ncbi:MAG: phage holin family protein [Gemmatimonadota bacterium]
MRLLLSWLINAAALYVTAWLVPGIQISGTRSLLLAALVIGLINAILKPILIFLTLPITIVTLGFFYLILNALLLSLAARLTPGFDLSGFGSAFIGALVMSVVGMILHSFFR